MKKKECVAKTTEQKNQGVEALEKEIKTLKMKIGGYSTSNEKYKKSIEELKSELVKLQEDYDKELKNSAELTAETARLQSLVQEQVSTINRLKLDNKDLKIELEYVKTPWWKKIF